jgi:hypothetical protein
VSPRQPLRDALVFWNENAAAAGWPQARSFSGQREKHLRNRLREHGLDGFKAGVIRARASPYLAGPDPPSWFTFPWIIKAENFLKVIEGNYDRNRQSERTNGMAGHQPDDGLSPTTRAAIAVFGSAPARQ